MTDAKLKKGNLIWESLRKLEKAELPVLNGYEPYPDSYSNVLAEFLDIEEYNAKIKARREALQKEFDLL